MILLAGAALAEPWSDIPVDAAMSCVRAHGGDAFLGDGRWEPWERAEKLGRVDACAGLVERPEAEREGWTPAAGVREDVRVAVGDAVPDGLDGDEEPGLSTTSLRLEGVAYAGPFFLDVEPELTLDAVPGVSPTARAAKLYGGVRWRGVSAGFGRRSRWLGPGRHSALLLSDNARPPWLGTVAVDGRLPGWFDHLGRLRFEAGAGWLDQPRTDVADPGLLLMDLRWLPVPGLEIGATRLSIFGGEGRPAVDVGQLLVPSEPHVYDDPDLSEPDQDELASIDLRVTLPVGKWLGLPIDAVEGWWQYGGEDVIARKLGPIPYPSLAGVGNLYGAAVRVKGFEATVEYTALLDDYFRWYIGHRVYHQGFTQLGRPLGQLAGADSETV